MDNSRDALKSPRVRAFLAKFVPALRKIRRRQGFVARSPAHRRRAIRLASDACLANTAGSSSIWSRCLDLYVRRKKVVKSSSKSRSRLRALLRQRRRAGLRSRVMRENREHDDRFAENMARVRALQKIVPGGKVMSDLEILLKETADYVVNLQSQVQAMGALLDLCLRSNNGSASPSAVTVTVTGTRTGTRTGTANVSHAS